jgi:hypothetical protein
MAKSDLQAPAKSKPRTRISVEERKHIWNRFLDGYDAVEICLELKDISLSEIRRTIEIYAINCELANPQAERVKVAESTRRTNKVLHSQFDDAIGLAETIKRTIESFVPEGERLGLDDAPQGENSSRRDLYFELLRAYQFQLGAISKVSSELRNNSDLLSQIAGIKRRPAKAVEFDESDRHSEPSSGSESQTSVETMSDEELLIEAGE